MVVGEKVVFDEAYEGVDVARSHFGCHCSTVEKQLSVRTSSARKSKVSELGFLIGR